MIRGLCLVLMRIRGKIWGESNAILCNSCCNDSAHGVKRRFSISALALLNPNRRISQSWIPCCYLNTAFIDAEKCLPRVLLSRTDYIAGKLLCSVHPDFYLDTLALLLVLFVQLLCDLLR